MTVFACTDLETTSVSVDDCEVVQAAYVEADDGLLVTQAASMLFKTQRPIPPASTKVHRLTDGNTERFDFAVRVIPSDAPCFVDRVTGFFDALTAEGVVLVTYNGCGYDLPIIARYGELAGLGPRAKLLALCSAEGDLPREPSTTAGGCRFACETGRLSLPACALTRSAPWTTALRTCAVA